MLLISATAQASGDTVAVIALVVACLSFGVAAAALGWQIAAWRLEAGRARVQLRVGAHSGSGLVTQAVDGKYDPNRQIEQWASQGFTTPVLAVNVTSIGRAPVTVQSWSAHARASGIAVTPIADLIGDPLPKRLEPGETKTWAVPLQAAIALVGAAQAVKDTGNVDDIYIVVELGSGKKLRTATSLSVRGS